MSDGGTLVGSGRSAKPNRAMILMPLGDQCQIGVIKVKEASKLRRRGFAVIAAIPLLLDIG